MSYVPTANLPQQSALRVASWTCFLYRKTSSSESWEIVVLTLSISVGYLRFLFTDLSRLDLSPASSSPRAAAAGLIMVTFILLPAPPRKLSPLRPPA
jgi:phosphatidylglycerophosphate synthase